MKKTKTEVTSALTTIPAKVEAAAVPKPSRKEIIELAAHRLLKREQDAYKAKLDAAEAELKAVRETIHKICLDNLDLAKAKSTVDGLYLSVPWRVARPDKFENAKINLSFVDVIPSALVRRYKAASDAVDKCNQEYRWLTQFYRQDNGLFKEAVRRVKELMEGVPSEGHRMPTFLADAELCKAVDAFIKKLETEQETKALKADAADAITVS